MTVKVEGLEEVLDKIRAIDDDALKRKLAESYGRELKEDVEPYGTAPPRTGNRYWERGYGWRLKSGRTRTKSGKGYDISEDALNQWEVIRTRKGAVVKNTASYAQYLYDKDRQPWFHRSRGWKTWQDMAEKNKAKYLRQMASTVEDHLNKA